MMPDAAAFFDRYAASHCFRCFIFAFIFDVITLSISRFFFSCELLDATLDINTYLYFFSDYYAFDY